MLLWSIHVIYQLLYLFCLDNPFCECTGSTLFLHQLLDICLHFLRTKKVVLNVHIQVHVYLVFLSLGISLVDFQNQMELDIWYFEELTKCVFW